MIEVNVVVPPELYRKLDPKQWQKALDKTVESAAEMLKDKLAGGKNEPGLVHSPVIWASDRQRRAYFASRKGLPLKYLRETDKNSQRLKATWTSRRTGQALYIVGNKATYAKFVQSAANQTAQHAATGWKTDVQAVAELERSGDIRRAAERAFGALTR